MSDETHTPLWLNAFVALVVAFLLAPLLVVIMVSFNNEAILRFPPRGFTLHWFVEALTYPTFVRALIFSTLLAALATFLSACIGVPAALAISRGGKSTAAIEAFEDGREVLLAPQAHADRDVDFRVQYILFFQALHETIGDEFVVFRRAQMFSNVFEREKKPGEVLEAIK